MSEARPVERLFPRLSLTAQEAYKLATLTRQMPTGAAYQELLAAGLLVVDTEIEPGCTVLSPREAQAQLRHESVRRDADAAALTAFLVGVEEQLVRDAPCQCGIEILEGQSHINDRIEQATENVRRDFMTAQPGGPRTAASLAISVARDTDVAQRGARVRTLYANTARDNAHTRARVEHMARLGAETRTSNDPFVRIIAMDDTIAFLPDLTDHGLPRGERAVAVTNPQILALVRALFDYAWDRAEPWFDHEDPDETERQLTKMQETIVNRLCAGRTQAQIAKELEVHAKTVQNHLAHARTTLDAQTNKELTFKWGALTAERRAIRRQAALPRTALERLTA